VRNSSLVERQGIDNNRASSIVPKLWIELYSVVGEHSLLRRRCLVMDAGAQRKANVGISNDNAGEKPARRKTKVS
jgi:hypothetical protein